MKIALEIVLAVVCVSLIGVILLQSGRSAGLSGFIGGGAEQIFGKRKGFDTFLSRLTVALAIALFTLCLVVAYLDRL